MNTLLCLSLLLFAIFTNTMASDKTCVSRSRLQELPDVPIAACADTDMWSADVWSSWHRDQYHGSRLQELPDVPIAACADTDVWSSWHRDQYRGSRLQELPDVPIAACADTDVWSAGVWSSWHRDQYHEISSRCLGLFEECLNSQ